MTHKEFLEWLDKKIGDNRYKERMYSGYLSGDEWKRSAEQLERVKEKFLTITPPPTQKQNINI